MKGGEGQGGPTKPGNGGTDSPRGGDGNNKLPVEKQTCIHNLFGICKEGDKCKRRHVMRCPKPIFEHPTFQKFLKEHGPPKNLQMPDGKSNPAAGAQQTS